MDAIKAEIGKKYLSKRGTPVMVVKHKGEKVVLKISGSENEIEVSKTYELKPYEVSKVNGESKALIRANGKNGHANGKPKREGSLSTLIDPFLFAGGHTVQEIAEQVATKAGELAKGKDMEANVRARMVTYRRKNYTIQKDDAKHVRILELKK